ncbi:MAG: DNRLRE domain-containing protein [Bacteroidetes bacterium]|nr:DNRLRE domain-containing protein [Bacteroidota bacterium]
MKTCTKPKAWLAGILLLFCLPAFAQESVTIKPCSDGKETYIRNDLPTTNYGNVDALAAAAVGNPSAIYRSFLEFDLAAIPPGAIITSAQINLWHYPGTGHSGNNATELRIVESSWSENALTWNTQPAASTVYTVLPQSTSGTQLYNVDVTGLVQDWYNGVLPNFGMCFQLQTEVSNNYLTFSSGDIDTPDTCPELIVAYTIQTGGDPICETDTLNVSTGFDNAAGTETPTGNTDSDWILTLVPQNAAGATPGNPAFVVAPNSAWDDTPNAQWISAYNFADYDEDNEDGNPYRFTNCFCLEQETDVAYDLDVMADNNVKIGILDNNGVYHLIGNLTDPSTAAFELPATNYTGSLTLPAGKSCMLADLRNLSGTAMGFWMDGVLINGPLGESECCGPSGIISGVKFEDKDCNGKYDYVTGGTDNDEYLPGWTIELYDAAGNLVQTTVTDQYGYYQFVGVPAGTYTVVEVQQSGYVQSLPTSGGYTIIVTDQGDQVFNNNDFGNCPQECGAVVNDSISISCSLDGTYEYYFSLDNLSMYNVTSVIFQSGPEFIWPNNNPYWAVNIPPSGNSGPFPGPVIIDPGMVITQPTTYCFDVIYFSDEYSCCHYEHCITLLPADPCENISVTASEIDNPDDGCCYESTLTNNFCPDYFVSITTEILTPGVTFGSSNGNGIWNVNGTNVSLNWTPVSTPNIPLGNSPGMTFCLENINSISQTPQLVAYHWEALNAAGELITVCSDTLEFFCEPCLSVDESFIECNADGTATFSFTVTNNTDPAHPSGQIVLEMINPYGLPLSQNVWNIPLNSGQSSPLLNTTILNPVPPPGTVLDYKVILYDLNGEDPLWCCHADTFSIVMPDCGQAGMCIDPDIIDPSIMCTTEFDPVCGCDNVTYTNACVAEFYNGVTSWTTGVCDQDDPGDISAEAIESGPGMVTLDWFINNPAGVTYYLVEHGLSPDNWNIIQEVIPVAGQQMYSILHDGAEAGLNYYKVSAVLFDGSILMSNVVEIDVNGPIVEAAVLLSPNPVGTEFSLAWTNLPDTDFDLKIVKMGQIVHQQSINGSQGILNLNAWNWQSGVYQILITNEKGFFLSEKLVKMKR